LSIIIIKKSKEESVKSWSSMTSLLYYETILDCQ
jgi:hypothetical protein